MVVARVEASPNNRAGCQSKECKDAHIKIMKGEFRYAIQITIKEHTSWQYRHWGCVTPKQIQNLIESSGGDTDMVDGFDEVPAEYQEKIKFALENGHIPDEDWKGDLEVNRPGQAGFRVKAAKKDAKKDDDGTDDEKPKKKRARKSNDADDGEDAMPAPKKSRAKKVVKTEEEDEAEAPAPAAKRGRPKKVVQAEQNEAEASAPAAKRGRPKKAAPKVELEDEDNDEVEEEVAKPKPRKRTIADGEAKVTQKRGRPKKTTADE